MSRMHNMFDQLIPPEPKPKKHPGGRHPKLKVGDKVGHWTLLEYKAGVASPRVECAWWCRCSCGQERWVRSKNLTSARSTSCGHVAYPHYPAKAWAA